MQVNVDKNRKNNFMKKIEKNASAQLRNVIKIETWRLDWAQHYNNTHTHFGKYNDNSQW